METNFFCFCFYSFFFLPAEVINKINVSIVKITTNWLQSEQVSKQKQTNKTDFIVNSQTQRLSFRIKFHFHLYAFFFLTFVMVYHFRSNQKSKSNVMCID